MFLAPAVNLFQSFQKRNAKIKSDSRDSTDNGIFEKTKEKKQSGLRFVTKQALLLKTHHTKT